jgi:hypothetical protein
VASPNAGKIIWLLRGDPDIIGPNTLGQIKILKSNQFLKMMMAKNLFQIGLVRSIGSINFSR